MPVPAPPPTIGRPEATFARNRSRIAVRPRSPAGCSAIVPLRVLRLEYYVLYVALARASARYFPRLSPPATHLSPPTTHKSNAQSTDRRRSETRTRPSSS